MVYQFLYYYISLYNIPIFLLKEETVVEEMHRNPLFAFPHTAEMFAHSSLHMQWYYPLEPGRIFQAIKKLLLF